MVFRAKGSYLVYLDLESRPKGSFELVEMTSILHTVGDQASNSLNSGYPP